MWARGVVWDSLARVEVWEHGNRRYKHVLLAKSFAWSLIGSEIFKEGYISRVKQ